MRAAAMEPPFTLLGPAEPQHPILLTVPHAGRSWTPAQRAAARHPVDAMLTLEDRHADRLVETAVAAGFTAFVAQTPRAWLDLNRAPDEFDWPRLTGERGAEVSARAAAGLGIVPDRIAGLGSLWRPPLSRGEVTDRVAAIHAPWHRRLGELISATLARHGEVVVLDVHSMPPAGAKGAEIVLGTRRGRSVAGEWVRVARDALLARRRRVAIDEPYAGAYLADRHGHPAERRHVLQLEFCRTLYLDRALRDVGCGLERAQADVLAVAGSLAAALSVTTLYPLAAE